MDIYHAIKSIKPVDKGVYQQCTGRFDSIAKPIEGLGMLEDMVARIGAAQGDAKIDISKRLVLVYCADNGVVRQGVTQTGSDVTTSVSGLLANGKATVTTMANTCGTDVLPVDMGMIDTVDGLLDKKLMAGTNDISAGPAMAREVAEQAIATGIELVRDARDKGYRLVIAGEVGIGNTTTSSAVACALLGVKAEGVTGRGAGLDSSKMQRKISIVQKAIDTNDIDRDDPVDVLAKVGGLDIAAMAGTFIGGALYGVPVVMDGFIASVAALAACRMNMDILDYIVPSHMSGEPGMKQVLDELGLQPVIYANMHLGEGTGAVAVLPLLDMALNVYNNCLTFQQVEIEQYRRLK